MWVSSILIGQEIQYGHHNPKPIRKEHSDWLRNPIWSPIRKLHSDWLISNSPPKRSILIGCQSQMLQSIMGPPQKKRNQKTPQTRLRTYSFVLLVSKDTSHLRLDTTGGKSNVHVTIENNLLQRRWFIVHPICVTDLIDPNRAQMCM